MAGGIAKVPQPKVRERKDGAAILLDDTDKRLMNLLQSSFPLAAEPYALLAREHDLDLDDLMERTQRLVSERIIREITPIFDTRALGFDSMLVAAKVDVEHPHRAAKIINSHPGVPTTTCARTSSTSGSRSRRRPTPSWGCRGRSRCSRS